MRCGCGGAGGGAQDARCCARVGVPLEGETAPGLQIGPGPVSGLREALSAPAWVGPRVPRWSDVLLLLRVAVALQGDASCPGPAVPLEPAAGPYMCCVVNFWAEGVLQLHRDAGLVEWHL